MNIVNIIFVISAEAQECKQRTEFR